jgi:Bifunctional DNA primase/polymerase, N-terminal
MGAFADYAMQLRSLGYSPVPIIAGHKRPLLRNWDRLRAAAMEENEIVRLARKHPDLGLGVAGGFNQLCPIDVDAVDPDLWMAIEKALPPLALVKRGRKGYTAFFRDDTGLIASRRFLSPPPDRRPLVEILVSGQTVIPPTLHPETRAPYIWLTDLSLMNVRVDELPLITPAHIDALATVLERWSPAPQSHVQVSLTREVAPVSDRRMLAYARKVLGNETLALGLRASGRNNALFAAACKVGRFAHHHVLSHREIRDALLTACAHNGLLRDDGINQCEATFASGLRKSEHDALPTLIK